MKDLNDLSSKIISSAIAVHRELGPGLLECVYQACMRLDLQKSGVEVESEVPLPVFYRGERVSEVGFRIDLLVGNRVVVELKSVDRLQPVHHKQLLTYLKLADKPLGLLINFNEEKLVNGISRVANSKS